MTTYYLAIRPFGDSTISLLLLSRLPGNVSDVRILGTPVVQAVADATGLARFPVSILLPDVAAFFDLRVQGCRRAARDLLAVRRALGGIMGAQDSLLLEQPDWRNGLLIPSGPGRVTVPRRSRSVYDDRREMLETHFGCSLSLPATLVPRPDARSMTVHPGARQAARAFPRRLVESLFTFAARHELEMRLIDPESRFPDLGARARVYLPDPALSDAVACLRSSDLFVGADSFFLHLAYYFQIPLFCIGETSSPYFSPPGMLEQGLCMDLTAAQDADTLFARLDPTLTRARADA